MCWDLYYKEDYTRVRKNDKTKEIFGPLKSTGPDTEPVDGTTRWRLLKSDL